MIKSASKYITKLDPAQAGFVSPHATLWVPRSWYWYSFISWMFSKAFFKTKQYTKGISMAMHVYKIISLFKVYRWLKFAIANWLDINLQSAFNNWCIFVYSVLSFKSFFIYRTFHWLNFLWNIVSVFSKIV